MRALLSMGAVLGVAAGAAACSSGIEGQGSPPPVGRTGLRVQSTGADETQDQSDGAGQIQTYSTTSFDTGTTGGFFANLGTNGRTCGTCHIAGQGWTVTPAGARSLPRNDPLFTPNDGSDCPPTSAAQSPDSSLSSLLLGYGLIRVEIGIPSKAAFSLASATNPEGCAIPPGSASAGGNLFLFRRPLPATNLIFDSTVMWDGRETLERITSAAGEQSVGPLLFDLSDQANGATTGHAQGASITGTRAQSDIVSFEMSLSTAESQFVTGQGSTLQLDVQGAHGGAGYIAKTVAPAFYVGINDPLGTGSFTNASFDVYKAWEPASPGYSKLQRGQQSIGRGEALFNGTTFTIHDVPGLNSVPGDPLYNPDDAFAGKDIVGGCGLCHDSPDVGSHSTSLPINIGVTMAQPTNNDGSPNTVLDFAELPVYTLRNSGTGATVAVTDPGRALITGSWTDVGKTKGPSLRGLASRAPYFHNGSARDLTTVVRFYDARFEIGLTEAQIGDMVAFLTAL